MTLRTQIFQVSTLYGAATVAAALDAGLFGPGQDSHRVLLVSNNAEIPETAPRLEEMSGYGSVAARFDSVVDWNEAISPHHPSGWGPVAEETVLWQRAFRLAWGIDPASPVDLAVESIQVDPARALAAIFSESALHVYADGLMSYGPTRDRIPASLACRVQRVLHLDLVPGLRPLLLTEAGVGPELVPDKAFRTVLAELARAADGDRRLAEAVEQAPTAVLLGQYLAALGILTAEEEEDLHVRMLRGAARAGHTSVLFKSHPTAPARYSRALEDAAAEAGVRLTTLDSPLLAETLYERCAPTLVVGCFSTAMFTAAVYYGIPVARVGTRLVLDRVTPYENSNRIPLTIVDHLVPDLEQQGAGPVPALPGAAPDTLAPLVRTVGYCMRSGLHPGLRAEAESWLRTRLDATTRHYFKRRRLQRLTLPGGGPRGTAVRLRRTVRRARGGLGL
ncbi:alpha-2,8-polysialyltransferase family protein [Streptomyces sp. NBC_01754]|uniref:polysialyltransferase family glycosyltransferase n=1 Tax=Streptomyces sp. NBC_01754 TaxID=2975930 RepID=UPI002DD86B8E|nr:polysialyltransferase family glycosyltransferase [Streptomyces sp. NBC_01754]WSC94453.1 alpha-2,8-polysialyltransferase family protein [Streptomyces sp. NBC_01754]